MTSEKIIFGTEREDGLPVVRLIARENVLIQQFCGTNGSVAMETAYTPQQAVIMASVILENYAKAIPNDGEGGA